jgi:hypothetical protein
MALYDDQGIKSSKKERKRAWLLSQKLHELDESDQEPLLLYSHGKVFQFLYSNYAYLLLPIFTLLPLSYSFYDNTYFLM